MASVVRTMLGLNHDKDTKMPSSPSFNDLSLGAHDDAAEQFGQHHDDTPLASSESPPAAASPRPARADVWQSVFNPGKNFNMRKVGNSYYDHVDMGSSPKSTWQHIMKSENMRHFKDFDRNADGFITEDELRGALGPGADVAALIKQADKNGDGKIDHDEFCEILRKS